MLFPTSFVARSPPSRNLATGSTAGLGFRVAGLGFKVLHGVKRAFYYKGFEAVGEDLQSRIS